MSDSKKKKNSIIDEFFFKQLFNLTREYLFITDDRGNIIEFNQAVKDNLGYGDELIGKTLIDLHPEESRLEASENLYKIIKGDLDYCPLDIVTKDGKIIATESRVDVFEYKGKKYFLGISRAKTESDKIDKLIKSIQKQFRKMFNNNISATMIISTLDNRIELVNKAFEKMSGYEINEVLGKRLDEVPLIEDIASIIGLRDKIISEGSISNFEVEINSKSDGKRVYRISGTSIDFNGSAIILSGIDITDSKDYQRSLEKQISHNLKRLTDINDMNKAVLEAIPDWVVLLDSNSKILKVKENTKASGLFLTQDDVGHNLHEIMPDAASFLISQAIIETKQIGSSTNNVFRYVSQGKKYWYSMSLSRVDDTNNLFVGVFRDISSSVWQSQEIVNSENKYKSIFNSEVASMVLISIEDGSILDVNRSASKLFGYSLSKLKQMYIKDILPEIKGFMQDYSNNKVINENFKTHIQTVEGIEKIIEVYISSLHHSRDKQLVIMLHDITEQVKSQEMLQKKQVQVRTLIEGTEAGLWDWNVKTGELILGGNYFKMLGYSDSDFKDINIQTWRDLCHEEDLKRSDLLIQKLISGETETYECEVRMRHKSGKWLWILDRGNILERDEHGGPLRLSGTHIDFSDFKKAQIKLKVRYEIEELINSIFVDFNLSDIFKLQSLFDKTLQKIGEFTNSDRAYLFLLDNDAQYMSNTNEWCAAGITPQIDFLKKLPISTFPWWFEQLSKFKTICINDTNDMIEEASAEQKILHEQDIKSVLVLPVYIRNNLLGFIGFDAVKEHVEWHHNDISLLENVGVMIAHKITQGKLQENLLHAKKVAEESNRIKSEFISNINHEVRTPLQAITSFLDLLKISDVPQEINDILPEVNQSTNSLLNIFESIVKINTIEKGKLDITNEEFNFKKTVKEVVLFFQSELTTKGIQVNYNFKEVCKWRIVADASIVKNILNSLFSNAVLFTNKGKIDFYAEINKCQDPKLYFYIQDTGVGMNEKQLANVYELFYQSEKFITKKYYGVGLGIPIVKKIIDLLGGEIKYESRERVGTKVMVTLPIQLSTKKVGKNELREGNPKILLVEDNLVIIKMMKRMLEKKGYKVFVASNGEIALKQSKERVFDIILMDIQMPVMDGLTATRLIKTDEQNLNYVTPIIAISAHINSKESAIGNYFTQILKKPVNSSILFKIIDKTLSVSMKN